MMPPLIFSNEVFNLATDLITTKSIQWKQRAIKLVQGGLVYLKDSRVAGMAIFALNFAIIEIAMRVGRLLSWLLPDHTLVQRNLKFVCLSTLVTGIIVISNIGLVYSTAIPLSPLVVTTLVITSFIAKIQLEILLQ